MKINVDFFELFRSLILVGFRFLFSEILYQKVAKFYKIRDLLNILDFCTFGTDG